jgi:hypothetical protein
MAKQYPTIGCCGLDCGLCPRYYTSGVSRCPGCCGPDFSKKHPACSFITCCVKKRNLEVCADCSDFPCAKFDRETGETDSFITHRRVLSNQAMIKDTGIEVFVEQQNQRIQILQAMLEGFDDGSCKSFYCLSAALLSIPSLNESLTMAIKEIQEKTIDHQDIKGKAKILKEILNQFAILENQELRLRKAKP